MDIYSFINSGDVADYCREIGKTWNPFEMAVIIGRSAHSRMADRHKAWRELIERHPDMPTPAAEMYPSYGSLHQKLAEVIGYEERALELFVTPEEGSFYVHEISDSSMFGRDETFASYEYALAKLKHDLRYMRGWVRDRVTDIGMTKCYIGSRHRIDCTFDVSCNVVRLNVAYCDERFPDIDFKNMLDLSTWFGHEGIYFVDIPVPFKRGDLLHMGRGSAFVLDKLCDREKMIVERSNESTGWGFFIDDNKTLHLGADYDNDRFEYYHGELKREEKILLYISMYLKGEIDLWALFMLQGKIIEEHGLKVGWSHGHEYGWGLELPQSVLDLEWPHVMPDPVIYSGIFWVIAEDSDLSDHQLLMFGIPCDSRGNITGAPDIQPNSMSGKTYNHKITWEAEVAGNDIHDPYNLNPYDYYPRGRVEIARRRATVFLNPRLNKPAIMDEIRLRFGLGNHELTKIRVVEDGSFRYKCFLDRTEE